MTARLNILALAGITLGSVGAEAQIDQNAMKCISPMGQICVYDANNAVIGVENSAGGGGVMQRYMNGQWYQLNYSTSVGFDVDAILLFEKDGCSGQPYFYTGYTIGPADGLHPGAMRLISPLPAGSDGFAVWGPAGPSTVIDVKSSSYEQKCYADSWYATPAAAAPAVKLETHVFPLPWKIR
jgi:hypothetical protein